MRQEKGTETVISNLARGRHDKKELCLWEQRTGRKLNKRI